MSGVHGQVFGHLVRRGFEVAQSHYKQPSQEYIAQLQQDARAYEETGTGPGLRPEEMLPMVITALIAMVIIASVRYTIGEVVASLTMIESPSSTAIIEDKPPAYADEPDAPLEKASLLPSEAEADIEVMVIRNKPVTAKISTTLRHLTSIGGFRARWRGFFLSVFYHFLHSAFTNFIAMFLGSSLPGYFLAHIFVSLGLSRLHMVWTHSMIAYPSAQPWWRRLVPRKQSRVILLPSLVFALAQQATFILPVMVAAVLRVQDLTKDDFLDLANGHNCGLSLHMVLRILAVPLTGLVVAIGVLLPASVTLTRVEAALLPEDQAMIVPFDRFAIMGDVDVTVRGAPKAIFAQAWRSFDRASRWRLIKLYAKMVLIQFTVAFTAVHLIVAEVFLTGSERIALVFKSGAAQLKLMAIEAQQNAN